MGIKWCIRLAAVAFTVVGFSVAGLALAETPQQMDTKPGPAYTMVDGKITKIDGEVYTVQNESANYQNLASTTNISEVRIMVGKETKKLHGDKKVGDKIRAEVTFGGFANSIQ